MAIGLQQAATTCDVKMQMSTLNAFTHLAYPSIHWLRHNSTSLTYPVPVAVSPGNTSS